MAAPEFGEEELMAFVRGELSWEREALVTKAMRISPSLRRQIAELRAFYEHKSAPGEAALDSPMGPPVAQTKVDPVKRGRFGFLLWAAIAGLLVAVSVFWPHVQTLTQPGSQDLATTESERPALPSAKPLAVEAPQKPRQQGERLRPALTPNLVSDLGARSDQNPATPLPKPRQTAPDRPYAHIVLLIDASGSMQLPAKIPLLQEAFFQALPELLAGDLLSIVIYAGAKGVLLPPTRVENVETILAAFTAMRTDNLQQVIDRNRDGGSASSRWGFREACSTLRLQSATFAQSRIILATDGDFQLGAESQSELLAMIDVEAQQGISLSVLGFSADAADETKMRTIAERGRGVYRQGDSVKGVMEFLKTQFATGSAASPIEN